MADAGQRGQPLRIVAHGEGGLVARLGGESADAPLRQMTEAYRRAVEESTTRSGAADYEIIFNALAGAFLLKARGQDSD